MIMESSNNTAEELQSLKAGSGIRHLVDEAFRILKNPVLVHDMDYKLIACTDGIVTDDPIWNEFASTGTVNVDRIEFYKEENFLDTVASVPKITCLHSDELKYDRIFAKLFNGDDIQIGCVVIVASHRPFGDDDLTHFETFCTILEKEIQNSDYYKEYGQAYQDILIHKLILGDIEDKAIYTAHVESIYTNLKTYLYLAVLDIKRCDPSCGKLTYYRDLFKSVRRDFKFSIFNDHILVIMSFENHVTDFQKEMHGLYDIMKENIIRAGISGCFENLFELEKYYFEAVESLSKGLKHDSGELIFARPRKKFTRT